MRILFVSDTYPTIPPFGGIGVYTRSAASALVARGHDVHVLVGRRGERADRLDGRVFLHIRPVRWLPRVAPWLPGLGESMCIAWALSTLHRRYHFDVVEFPNCEGIALVSTALRLAPIVVRLYTSTLESSATLGRPATLGERFVMWAERQAARLARRVVTHSRAHARALGRAYDISRPVLIPLGLDATIVASAEQEEPLAVLIVGAMNARKGTDILLDVVPRVLRAVPGSQFWIVGTDRLGAFEQQLRAQLEPSQRARIRFWGFVGDDVLSELYARCSIYASTSRYESFGLTFVEAMLHEKPTVGFAVGAIPEVVANEDTGLLVAPFDASAFAEALVRLLRAPRLREQQGSAGRRRALELFSLERMGRDIERLFARV